MNNKEILQRAREIWGEERCDLNKIITLLGVVYGDLCRQNRLVLKGREIDAESLKKEIGNIIVSMIRWCDDLGLNLDECIERALAAQDNYANRNKDSA